MTDLAQRLCSAEMIVDAVAGVALGYFRDRSALAVANKGSRDFVSEADRQVELAARHMLAEHFPGEVLIGEEFGGHAGGDYWIIDPIDGTTNFLSGLPLWAVSLAFVSGGEPVLGVIAIPAIQERFAAANGLGIRGERPLEGAHFAVSPVDLAGVGRNGHWPAAERFALEQRLETNGISTLCLGSCATSLAMVATGRLTGYAERHVKPWDVAAGQVLCVEANKSVSMETRGEVVDIVAGTSQFLELASN